MGGSPLSVGKPLSDRLARLAGLAEHPSVDLHQAAPNLAHAFAACLTNEEVCDAVIQTLPAGPYLRSVLLGQLFSRAQGDLPAAQVDEVVAALSTLGNERPILRVRADAVLSHIYPALRPPTREAVLELWLARGSPSAASRWLKAISGDELLFSVPLLLTYWRATHDRRAAKILAERADPELLSSLLPNLLQICEEGWIIQRAVLRASYVSEETWGRIHENFPVTYIYLCAKTQKPITEAEAHAIIEESEDGFFGLRGLAIWSAGQLGMWDVLERVYSEALAARERIGTVDGVLD